MFLAYTKYLYTRGLTCCLAFFVTFLLSVIPATSRAGAPVNEGFSITFMGARLIYDTINGDLTQELAGGYSVSDASQWKVEHPAPNTYQFGYESWGEHYIQLNIGTGKAVTVVNRKFGDLEGGKAFDYPHELRYEASGDNPKGRIIIPIQSVVLTVRGDEVRCSLEPGPKSKEWEVKEVAPWLFHLRHMAWNDFFMEYDAFSGYLFEVRDRGYGERKGGRRIKIEHAMIMDRNRAKRSAFFRPDVETVIKAGMGDLDFKDKDLLTMPFSNWNISEKRAYSELLWGQEHDIMIAPLQVEGYAFDMPNRSLVTRHFAARVAESTDLRVVDPSLVSLAMGVRGRTFNPGDIYSLANQMKVKYLVLLYGGHDKREKMWLRVTVLDRDEVMGINERTPSVSYTWEGIPFSDDNPPAEKFLSIVDEAVSKLPFVNLKQRTKAKVSLQKTIRMPVDPMSMVRDKPKTPVHSAYYLQLFGVLYPDDLLSHPSELPERHGYFERSLIALRDVSPGSGDYALLKARAWFYLHSRPAALKVLEVPTTPAEKAFRAYIDGNLTDLEKWTKEITSPLKKLFAELEINDLRASYGIKKEREEYEAIAEEHPGWAPLIMRRLEGRSSLNGMGNLELKAMLDEAFPIPNYTADEILQGAALIGGESALMEKTAFFVTRHYRKALGMNKVVFAAEDGSSRPVELDYLRLLHETSIANIVQKLRYIANLKGGAEQVISATQFLDKEYKGHPELTHARLRAYQAINNNAGREERARLFAEIRDLKSKVCYWAQAQTVAAQESCGGGDNYFYFSDYPSRWYFAFNRASPLDRIDEDYTRKQVVINTNRSLLYSNDYFASFHVLYNYLTEDNKKEDAAALFKVIDSRFVGSPGRKNFMLENILASGDKEAAKAFFKKSIESDPEEWRLYNKLVLVSISEGDYESALKVAKSYPYESGNILANSYNASQIGLWFYSRGAVDEAGEMFRLSEKLASGSGVEPRGTAYNNLLNGNMQDAAKGFLNAGKNSSDHMSYDIFLMLIHALGYHDQGKSMLNTLGDGFMGYGHSHMLAMRMEGRTEEEIKSWFFDRCRNSVHVVKAAKFMFKLHAIDRPPDENLQTRIREVGQLFYGDFSRMPEDIRINSKLAQVADAYTLMRMGDYRGASAKFYFVKDDLSGNQHKRYYDLLGFVTPYIARSAAKAGDTRLMAELLDAVGQHEGSEFYVYLSKAYLKGSEGKHTEAIEDLELARATMPGVFNSDIDAWYQLVEAAELLYADSGNEVYRSLALKLARTHQRLAPMISWAYAVEAKYTDDKTDRVKALAITLYLDKRSERISGFSEAEKKKALKWLGKNNPFKVLNESDSTVNIEGI